MFDSTPEERYFMNMGALIGSMITYILYSNVPALSWYIAWVIILGYAVYNALK